MINKEEYAEDGDDRWELGEFPHGSKAKRSFTATN